MGPNRWFAMSALFISYNNQDQRWAVELHDRLVARGYEVFLDRHPESGIPAGADWQRIFYPRLKDCRALIVLCSDHWTGSRWCFGELLVAKTLGKSIFPLRLDDCDLGPIAGEHQAIDLARVGEA